jgi:hypothetical protein
MPSRRSVRCPAVKGPRGPCRRFSSRSVVGGTGGRDIRLGNTEFERAVPSWMSDGRSPPGAQGPNSCKRAAQPADKQQRRDTDWPAWDLPCRPIGCRRRNVVNAPRSCGGGVDVAAAVDEVGRRCCLFRCSCCPSRAPLWRPGLVSVPGSVRDGQHEHRNRWSLPMPRTHDRPDIGRINLRPKKKGEVMYLYFDPAILLRHRAAEIDRIIAARRHIDPNIAARRKWSRRSDRGRPAATANRLSP